MTSRIARIDSASKRMFGYSAYATVDGRSIKRFYSDRRFGGPERAFDAAKAAVEEIENEHLLYLSLKRRYHRRANSPADIPGVNRVPKIPDGKGGYWVARWHDASGRRLSRKFSVKALGEREAYERGLQMRLQQTLEERSLLCQFRVAMADFAFSRPD